MQNVSVAFKMLTKVKTKLIYTKVSIGDLWSHSFFVVVKTFNKNRQAKL